MIRVENINKTRTSTYYGLFVALILFVALLPRLWDLSETNMWVDEFLTEFRATAPMDETLDSLYQAGNQVPLYFMMTRVLPHDGELALRLPSVILGVIGIALFMYIVYDLYQRPDLALWAGLLMTVNPLHVILSRTARPYPLLMILGLVMSYSFLLLLRGDRRPLIWGTFLMSSLLGYLTHYATVAVVMAQVIVLAVVTLEHKRRFLRNWVVVQAIAVIPLLIWVNQVFNNMDGLGDKVIRDLGLGDIPITLWHMLLGYDGSFHWLAVPGLIVGTIGLIGGTIYVFRQRREDIPSLYFLVLLICTIVPLFVLSVLVSPAYRDRYMFLAMPAAILLFLLGYKQVVPYMRQFGEVVVVLVVLTNAYHLSYMFADGAYQRSNWSDVTDTVRADYSDGDLIVFDGWGSSAAFKKYYQGDQIALQENALFFADMNERVSSEQAAQRIWLIYRSPHDDFHQQGWLEDFDPYQPALTPISDWLIEHRNAIIKETHLDWISVFLIEESA